MFKRLVIITLLFAACTAWGAATKLYELPLVNSFRDDSRMYIHDSMSGSRNINGAQLKTVINSTAWDPDYTKVFQINSTATSAPNLGNRIVNITRDRKGVVTSINFENGGHGIGVPYFNHRYVYPFNGMTNVRRDTPLVIGTVWGTRGVIVTPNISIQGGPALTIKGLYYGGKVNGLPNFGVIDDSASSQSMIDAFFWGTPSVGMLEPNTTYTIRSNIAQDWGGHGSIGFVGSYQAYSAPPAGKLWGQNPCRYVFATYSSGPIMENYSTTICRSTFRTGSN